MKLTIEINMDSQCFTKKSSEVTSIIRRCADKLDCDLPIADKDGPSSWFICDDNGDEVGKMEIAKP